MAGTLPGFSLSQQMAKDGTPLAGGVLKFYQAGSVATPQIAYQDSGLTIPVVGGTQLTCDEFGRLPQFFLADGSIKIALFDKNGVTQVTADGLLVIGASSGGGGGSPVDPTTILQTGWVQAIYTAGLVTGFVRCNGRTIGSATSGATERANSDTQALYLFLWATGSLVVTGGAGASGAADWAANKSIALPDLRGRTIAGLDDMGNSAASRLTTGYFGALATTLGVVGGLESQTLTQAQLPNVTLNVVIPSLTSTQNNIIQGNAIAATPLGGGASAKILDSAAGTGTITTVANSTVTAALGSGNPHNNTQPTMVMTIYIKL